MSVLNLYVGKKDLSRKLVVGDYGYLVIFLELIFVKWVFFLPRMFLFGADTGDYCGVEPV